MARSWCVSSILVALLVVACGGPGADEEDGVEASAGPDAGEKLRDAHGEDATDATEAAEGVAEVSGLDAEEAGDNGPGDAAHAPAHPTQPSVLARWEGVLGVGTARRKITPDFEPYTDVNDNHRWDEGEPFEDDNGNGTLDSVYIGGMGVRQPTGVHDDLWARALALWVGDEVLVLVVVDALGISMKRVDGIRERVRAAMPEAEAPAPERIWVVNTHTHSGPDTIGIFGPEERLPDGGMRGSYDDDYLETIEARAAEAVVEALSVRTPAKLFVASAHCDEGFVRDIDPPDLRDPYVGILAFRGAADDAALATLVSVANHPETLWKDFAQISSDFPHVLRERLEAEVGGMAFYVSGALGLMQTPVNDVEAGPARMQAIGDRYADAVVAALDEATALPAGAAARFGFVGVPTRFETIELYAGVKAGIVDGYEDYLYRVKDDQLCGMLGCLDLPVGALRLGDLVTLVSIPGELTPELVVGGIRLPEEADNVLYPDAPDEPVLKDHLATPHRFLLGLSNAEVGYIMPKKVYAPADSASHKHAPGPHAAGALMTGLSELLDALVAL